MGQKALVSKSMRPCGQVGAVKSIETCLERECKDNKGVRRMPWQLLTMKDVRGCDMSWGAAY